MALPPAPPTPRRPGEVQLKAAKPAPDLLEAPEGDGFALELPVVQKPQVANRPGGRPAWLRAKLPYGETFRGIQKTIEDYDLHTVCSSARCPNMGECWSAGTATFMILGNVCTRGCSFCAVLTGRPEQKDLDWDEPRRVAEAAKLMGLKHVVVTSINRDDRKDGGAPIFAEVIRLVHAQDQTIEVLIPDMKGERSALRPFPHARVEGVAAPPEDGRVPADLVEGGPAVPAIEARILDRLGGDGPRHLLKAQRLRRLWIAAMARH